MSGALRQTFSSAVVFRFVIARCARPARDKYRNHYKKASSVQFLFAKRAAALMEIYDPLMERTWRLERPSICAIKMEAGKSET